MKRKRKWIFALCTAAVMCCAGCGTIVTLSNSGNEGTEHGLIYSGVRFDYRMAFDYDRRYLPLLNAMSLVDMPFSLVCDTGVLPYTVIKTALRKGTKKTEGVSDEPSQAIGAPAPQPER